jgi:hypothetical protein
MSNKVIWVNPVPRISYQGRHKQVYTIQTNTGEVIPTRVMNKIKEDGVPTLYQFPADHQTGKLRTNLGKERENPFKGLTIEELRVKYNIPPEWSDEKLDVITKQSLITRQLYYEIKHGVVPGYYTDKMTFSMLQPNSRPGEKTFLERLTLSLDPRPNRFCNDTPRQEMLMEMIEVVPAIAPGKNLANSAFHGWYVSQENEDEEERQGRNDIIEKATFHLYKLKHELGAFRAYQIAIVLKDYRGEPILVGDVSTERVNNILSEYVTTSSDHQMKHIDNFMKAVDAVSTKDGLERFNIKYLVQQAINTNIISIKESYYKWWSQAGTANMASFDSLDALVNRLYMEFEHYDGEDMTTNYYGVLLKELNTKGVKTDVY